MLVGFSIPCKSWFVLTDLNFESRAAKAAVLGAERCWSQQRGGESRDLAFRGKGKTATRLFL